MSLTIRLVNDGDGVQVVQLKVNNGKGTAPTLVEQRVDAEPSSPDYRSALHIAIERGMEAVAKAVVERFSQAGGG